MNQKHQKITIITQSCETRADVIPVLLVEDDAGRRQAAPVKGLPFTSKKATILWFLQKNQIMTDIKFGCVNVIVFA